MHIAAVIVSWNSRQDTLDCLAALTASELQVERVILVDNASRDQTCEAVQITFPDVEILPMPTNRHYAAGANAGIRRALDQNADFIWLLNPDATVTASALTEMLRVFQNDTSAGVVGPRLVHPDGRIVIGANCDFRAGAVLEPAVGPDSVVAVDYVWGCAMLLRARMLQEIGTFDETLVAYFEDTDLCLRGAKRGWRTLAVQNATVYHHGSKATNQRFLQQMALRAVNWLRVYYRHAPPKDRLRLVLVMFFYRYPLLVWSTLRTIIARTIRPREHPVRLWS